MNLPSRRAVLLAILVLLLATLLDDRVVPTDVPAPTPKVSR